MDKKQLDERISKLIKTNKAVHSSSGANAQNIKKLNYLILETLYQGASCDEILRGIASGGALKLIATKPTYDLLCRVVEQSAYPSIVYSPDISAEDDLKYVKNCAFDETRVRSSQWYKNFEGLYGVTEDERYRFAQCYMLIEQFGREEYVIDKMVGTVLGFKHDRYFAKGMIGKSYHNQEIEIEPKLDVIKRLSFCEHAEFDTLMDIISRAECDTPEEYALLMRAHQSGIKMASSNAFFKSTNSRGVKGDGGVYPLQRFKNGIPYDVDKYDEAYSMANATNLAMTKVNSVKSHLDRVANTVEMDGMDD